MSQENVEIVRRTIDGYMSGDGSGVEINQHTFWVHAMRDGKIMHTKLFVDREQALEVAGLR